MKKENTKKIVKQLLRNKTCNNCRYLIMSEEERQQYRSYWGEESSENWCLMMTNRPKENVCINWKDEVEDQETLEEEFLRLQEELEFIYNIKGL